jgi:hypothetical protein
MLLRFGVSNYRSLRDYQELLLTASLSLKKESPTYLFSVAELAQPILPAIGIYGANASGKSNLLRALAFMHEMILNSHIKGPAKGGLLRYPFRLAPEIQKQPSRFDSDVLIEGKRYHYGFVVDDERVLEEWLYAYPSPVKHHQVWFHRHSEETPQFYFGKALKGKNKTIESLTRSNSLFLSAAAQNNHEQLTKVHNHFANHYLFLLQTEPQVDKQLASYLFQSHLRTRMMEFLKGADTGIVKAVLGNVAPLAEGATIQEQLQIFHRGVGGAEIFLKLEDESHGTMRLLTLLGPIFAALDQGKMVILDELDASMHSLLAIKLLNLFNSPQFNPKGAQLLFTTHDTNLLGHQVLRRDQIWFTEKDKEGATYLYPLTDIRTRHTDNLAEGYLQGRFGGVPWLGNLDFLPTSEDLETRGELTDG